MINPESEEQLTQRIGRINTIINGLENYAPFRMVVDDFRRNIQLVDGTWFTVDPKDVAKICELQATKRAALAVINLIDEYKSDLKRAQEALESVRDPEIQKGYYDYEPQEPVVGGAIY